MLVHEEDISGQRRGMLWVRLYAWMEEFERQLGMSKMMLPDFIPKKDSKELAVECSIILGALALFPKFDHLLSPT